MKTNIFLDPVRGLLINYFPEEPEYCATGPLSSLLCRSVCNTMTDGNCTCVHIQSEYETALSTAKREAVPLADQERGLELLKVDRCAKDLAGWKPEPGKLYPVDVKWEKREEMTGMVRLNQATSGNVKRTVAYILPSEEVVPAPQSQETQGWISVKERLPEPGIKVLVCLQYGAGNQEITFSYTTKRFPDCFDHLLNERITFWHELPPSPPKE